MADQQAQPPSTPPQAPKPGTQEHDGAMADLFDSAQKPSGQPPENFDTLILGKFKTQADLEAAYKELESRLGGQPKETPKETPKPPAEKPKGSDSAPPSAWDKASQELADAGELSAETVKALKDSGTPETVIQSWVKQQAEGVQTYRNAMAEAAGGPEQFEQIRQWASQALSQAEKTALQDLVASGDVVKAKLAVETMKARYIAANGSPPAAPVGGKTPGSSTAGYESVEQMIADMARPEYKQDPAFREKVKQRVEVTTAF